MLRLSDLSIVESQDALKDIPDGKVLINTINAHSFNVAQKDELFAEALAKGDYLIPDGASIIKACKMLKAKSLPICSTSIPEWKSRLNANLTVF